MHVMAVVDVLVVHDGGGDTAEPVAPLHQIKKTPLELLGVTVDDAIGVLAEDLHLALVALAHAVALESVLVSALLLAHLAVPSELLESLGLDSIGDCLRCKEIVLSHEDFRAENWMGFELGL